MDGRPVNSNIFRAFSKLDIIHWFIIYLNFLLVSCWYFFTSFITTMIVPCDAPFNSRIYMDICSELSCTGQVSYWSEITSLPRIFAGTKFLKGNWGSCGISISNHGCPKYQYAFKFYDLNPVGFLAGLKESSPQMSIYILQLKGALQGTIIVVLQLVKK